jgi:diguanylate cyclase (GGDEF)-like protein
MSVVEGRRVLPIALRQTAPSGRTLLAAYWVVAVTLDLLPATASLTLPLVALGSIAIMAVSIRRYRPAHEPLWWTVVAALVLFTAGGAVRDGYHTLGELGPGRSLVPDMVILPGYLLLVTALVGFVIVRTRESGRRLEVIYGGLIAALALLAYCWVFIMERVLVLAQDGTPLPVRAVLVCYPATSLFLVATALQVVFSSSVSRTSCERFFAFTMACMFAGDLLFMLVELHFADPATGILDLPYVLAYLGAASLASRPSMRSFAEAKPEVRDRWSPGRILLVAIAFSTPAVLLLAPVRREDRFVLLVIVGALTMLGILQFLEAMHTTARSERRLRYLASHDGLTGLANRMLLERELALRIERAGHSGGLVAVLFLDLDRFKLINDTLGHAQGDLVLCDVATRLRAGIADRGLVGRIGGDEFLVVLDDVRSVGECLDHANRLRRVLGAPYVLAGGDFHLTASVGLACTPEGGAASAESLIRDADTALYQAKEAGRDTVAVFETSMRTVLAERVDLERDLRHAVEDGQLHLVYQPIVRLRDGKVIGIEALVRWAHPRLGVIMPGRFIPLAEQSDVILEIGNWVLETALAEVAKARRHPGLADLCVAVNVSAVQLRDQLLVQRVLGAIEGHGVPGEALCVELTESAMMHDPNAAVAILEALRRHGVQVAVDDFGTEYSSLAYLSRLPVDVLKIDRSFVEGLRTGEGAHGSLVMAIVAMAKALAIETIAEGVETSDQAARLAALGCDNVQGYLYARPVRADQLVSAVKLIGVGSALGAAEGAATGDSLPAPVAHA